jgi:uncharacterized protein (DUF427 family)
VSLTFKGGPLSESPSEEVNYTLEGPAAKLMFQPFPRRVRIVVQGREVIDTTEGKLLHETGLLPVFYAPESDVDLSLLADSKHHTECPYKGIASYKNFIGGEKRDGNLFWHYPEPIEGVEWLRGYLAPYRARVRWFDEDEEIFWHLRDPYTRVDVRHSSRPVRVSLDGRVLAETAKPAIVSENGLPNRYYVPREDVNGELLLSERPPQPPPPPPPEAHCPYKGDVTWHSLKIDGETIEDAAWSYEDPFESALKAKGMLCFSHAKHPDLVTEVDGAPVEQ